ncbi:MAG: glycosyltransferase family 1 protein [Patescibacteria group bacterium]
MLIGIDGNEANVEKRVGIGEYAYELLMQFHKSQISNLKFQIYLKEQPRVDMLPPTEKWRYKIIGPKKIWTQFALPVSLFLGKKPDVFFTPSHYAPRFSSAPTVISVMDLSFIRFPELFAKKDLYQLKNWTAYSVKNAKKILTISEFSKNDIIKEYEVEPKDIIVTYPGIRENESSKVHNVYKAESMKDLNKKFGINKEYILFVGTLQPRKNIEKLIEAFSKIDKDIFLVIVGKKGWLYDDILKAPQKFGILEKVKFLDFVSDSELPSLYKNALCFVLPSLYEGFGLPVLEAMKNGCPVITSNVSSLPEAGGDAALYFDPENTDEISKTIEKVIEDKNLREEMIKKGYLQVKKFSWEKTAKQTLKVLEEVGNK